MEELHQITGSSKVLVVSVLIKNTDLGWESAGSWASRLFSSFFARFHLRGHSPTVVPLFLHFSLSILPSFLRFARFRVIDILLTTKELEVRREMAQNAKAWPFFRFSLSRSRSCGNLQQSTKCAWPHNLSPQSKTLRRATARV